MSTLRAYEQEPYRQQLEVEVVAVGEAEGRPWAALDDTILYPEGGGQPADHGHLGEVAVVDSRTHDGAVRHVLAAPVEVGWRSTLRLDWGRRWDHMQQHTAQHLLSALAADRFGWPTTSFHLLDMVCDIEVEAPDLGTDELEALEEAVNAEIRAARPINGRRVEPGAIDWLGVRSRGLPEGHTGTVRLVEIEGLDLNTCGGTHLANTAEIGSFKLLGCEAKRGGQRLIWLAGDRVRRRLGEHEARNAELRKVLGAGDDELATIAATKLDQLKDALRRQKYLAGQLAEAEAERLAHRGKPRLEAHYDEADAGFLQTLARRFQKLAPGSAVLLTAKGSSGIFFLLAAGQESSCDIPALGRRVAELLEGRGGGKGANFQGKAGSLGRRAEAVAAFLA